MLLTILGGLAPGLAESALPHPAAIGHYKRFGLEMELNQKHVKETPGGLLVEGPAFTSELRISKAFLDESFDAWGTDAAFSETKGAVVVLGRIVEIKDLQIGSEPSFTWGHASQIRFLDRPMWISADQEEESRQITLTMEDGDPSGQSIYIAKSWLWDRGIHKPDATHEDGSKLSVSSAADNEGFVIEVPHFSRVILNPADLTVLGRQDGVVFPHPGATLWYPDEQRLEIDVPLSTKLYDVLVEKDWLDFNIPWLSLREKTWSDGTHGGTDFLVTRFLPSETPGVLVFETFAPADHSAFTRGNAQTITFWAVDDIRFNETPPMSVSFDSQSMEFWLETEGINRILINAEWLAGFGIVPPHFLWNGEEATYWESYDASGWIIQVIGSGTLKMLAGTGLVSDYLRETRDQSVRLKFEGISNSAEAMHAAYLPWIEGDFSVYALNLSWGYSPELGGYLTQIELVYDLVVLATASHQLGEPVSWVVNATLVSFDSMLNEAWGLRIFIDNATTPIAYTSVIGNLVTTNVLNSNIYIFAGCNGPTMKLKSQSGVKSEKYTGTRTAADRNLLKVGWARVYEYGTCFADEFVKDGELRYELSFGARGPSLIGYGASVLYGAGFTVKGEKEVQSEDWYLGTAYIQADRPWHHLRLPVVASGTYTGAWAAEPDGTGLGREQGCSTNWQAHLAYTILTGIASAATGGGIFVGVLLGAASPLVVACSRTVQEQYEDVGGNPGLGPRMNALSSQDPNKQGGARTAWQVRESMSGGPQPTQDVDLRFQGAARVHLSYTECYGYSCYYYDATFLNYHTTTTATTYRALMQLIEEN